MEETFILNELKNLILLKTGIRTITPSDCKRISIEISKELNKNVSETTIKRLFGFAVVKHKFSRFTLTTLLEYVDKEDLTKLLPKHPFLPHTRDGSDDWMLIEDSAKRITDLTIKSTKHRSGLPYHMTIERKFAEKDFEEFYESDAAFTCFISQPGYGRTILLCQLAEKYAQNPSPLYQSCTLLFVSAGNLFNNEYKTFNLEEQLQFQLSINPPEGLIAYINNQNKLKPGKFIIFINGFTDLILRRDLKFQVFESIINFISAIEDSPNIKLVMSMRSTTWVRFYERIRYSVHLKSKWFPGNYFNLNETSNVPPFTEKEVDQILVKINNSEVCTVDPKLKAQLKYPYHFQLYYQLKEEDPNFNHSSNSSFYELITKFIQEKIYRSNYYTEKILFLKKLIQLTDYAKNGSSVAKDDLINELATFKNAYMELISGGILMEEKHLQNAHPKEYVRFVQPHVFEYFLFIELLEKYHLKLDLDFFKSIKSDYEGGHLTLSLLQWSIRFVVRIGDIKALDFIFELEFSNQERNQIILFTAENLKYRLSYSVDILALLEKFHFKAIKHLLNFDLLDASFKKSLDVLLEIADTNENKVIYQSILAIIDALKMDGSSMQLRLARLENLQPLESPWFISPQEFTSLILQKINGVVISEHPVLEKIELFKQDHKTFVVKDALITTQEEITYFYIFSINTFYGNPLELVKIVRSILRGRPQLLYSRSIFSTYLLSLLAIASAQTSPGEKTDQMERLLNKLSQNKSRDSFTGNSTTLLKLVQAEQNRNRGEYQLALQQALDCFHLYKQADLKAISLILYNLIIRICMNMEDFEKANEYKYEKYSFMEENNISKYLFPFPQIPQYNS